MGQKTHPVGFRLGTSLPWRARWFASKGSTYSALAIEDQRIRETIRKRYQDSGGIAGVEIERGTQELVVSIHTSRPGIIIGRGGQRVDELRNLLDNITGKRTRLNIQEIRQAELNAYLVGRNIAEQLERRIAFRRAMRQSATRTMQAGAEGIKVLVSGRLGGAEIARSEKIMEGRVPLHTLRANIDFAIAEAATTFGRIGVKVWIYKGETVQAQVEDIARHAIGSALRPPAQTDTTEQLVHTDGEAGASGKLNPDSDSVGTADSASSGKNSKPTKSRSKRGATSAKVSPVATGITKSPSKTKSATKSKTSSGKSKAEAGASGQAQSVPSKQKSSAKTTTKQKSQRTTSVKSGNTNKRPVKDSSGERGDIDGSKEG